MSSPSGTGGLELFEKENLENFQHINVTAIADYIIDKNHSLIITGDSEGVIRSYKREGGKLHPNPEKQIGKTKIEQLIVNSELKNLYILQGGNLFIYELPDLKDKTPKDNDKESAYLKDIAKIVENESPKDKDTLMIIAKKTKKLIFLQYKNEISKFYNREYKDKSGKTLEIILHDIPDKIRWYGNYFSYILKSQTKVFYNIIESNSDYKNAKLIESSQDLPAEDIGFIQSSWITSLTGFCLFTGTDGQAVSKNMITLNPNDEFIQLEIFNDLYIFSLYKNSVGIYNYNDGECVLELTIDTNEPIFNKFMTKVSKSIFLISVVKSNEKDFVSRLWELRELSFEKQIDLSLETGQIEKAFGILNNKLEYNMEKFIFLESFYCECAWNCFKKRNKEGYEEAQKYFSLCNFNPFELIYHYLQLLDINPIHFPSKDINELPNEVKECQIDGDVDKDENVKEAVKMLVEILQMKKTYLFNSNNLSENEKGNIDSVESTKNIKIIFESSKNCPIKIDNREEKLYDVIKIINEALIKGMVLLKTKTSIIEDIIENDLFNKEYLEEFLKDKNTFTSNMTLAFIYKKTKKYNEVLEILKPYIDDLSKAVENKESRNLLQKILIDFGKNIEYSDIFENGLKILLKYHQSLAFEILLTNELISIDNFLENILPDFDKSPTGTSKKESFLKLLCEDKKYSNYSNDKYQSMYMELLSDNLFNEVKKDYVPPPKSKDSPEYEGLPKRYKDFKELCTKFTKYRKNDLLAKIKDSWMFDIEIYLYTELQKYNEAIQKLVELVKSNHKDFEDIREYCKTNYPNDANIFKQYFQNLKKNYDENNDEMKMNFKREMLKILELFVNGELLDEEVKKNKNKLELLNLLDPQEILGSIPNDWKLNEPLDEKNKDKTLYNLLRFYLKEYAIINNNYKRLENLAKMDLIYKQMKLHELRDKHVFLDINTSCYLCNKKIQNNTVFLVYPNGHIYHSRCSPDLHIEIKTGRNFENFDY